MALSYHVLARSRTLVPVRRIATQTDKPIVLYDIPSKGRCSCWSPNVWKTRLVLHYKQLPYITEWTEYPEIEPKLKGLGIPPNPPRSWSDYSCPTVRLPNGEYVMDSLKIVRRLEQLYPQPPLLLERGLQDKVLPAIGKAVNAARPMIWAGLSRNVLREPSATFFAEDRYRRLGKTLDQYKEEKGGEAAWALAHEGLESLRGEFDQHQKDEGPFLLGSTVSYGDFLIVAILNWLEITDKQVYEGFVGHDERFKRLHEACRPWLKRDDH